MTRTHTRARVHTRAKCITTGITRTRTQQPEHKFKVTPSPRTPPTTSHLPAHLSHLHWSPTRFCNLLLLSCKKTKKKTRHDLCPTSRHSYIQSHTLTPCTHAPRSTAPFLPLFLPFFLLPILQNFFFTVRGFNTAC